MRNLKKVLALGLVFLLAIGLMAPAFAALDYTDAGDIDPKYKEAAEILTALGIIKGKSDTEPTLDPKGQYTRAQMAQIVANIDYSGDDFSTSTYNTAKYNDVTSADFVPAFPDMDDETVAWANPAVTYLKEIGLASGKGDGLFHPKDPLTVAEALKVFLKLLGYDPQNTQFTNAGPAWVSNIVKEARFAGLFDVVGNLPGDSVITREQVMQIAYNMLVANPVLDYSATTNRPIMDDSKLYGQAKYGFTVVNTTVVATDYAALAGESITGADKFTIAAVAGSAASPTTDYVQGIEKMTLGYSVNKIVDGDSEAVALKDMIGRNVKIIYQLGRKAGINTKTADIVRIYSITVGGTITPVVSNTYADAIKDLTATGYATYINYERTNADITALPKGSPVNLVDTTADGKYDFAFAINYTTSDVAKNDAEGKKFSITDGGADLTDKDPAGFIFGDGEFTIGKIVNYFKVFGGKYDISLAPSFKGTATKYVDPKMTITAEDATTAEYLLAVPTSLTPLAVLGSKGTYYTNGTAIVKFVSDTPTVTNKYAVITNVEASMEAVYNYITKKITIMTDTGETLTKDCTNTYAFLTSGGIANATLVGKIVGYTLADDKITIIDLPVAAGAYTRAGFATGETYAPAIGTYVLSSVYAGGNLAIAAGAGNPITAAAAGNIYVNSGTVIVAQIGTVWKVVKGVDASKTIGATVANTAIQSITTAFSGTNVNGKFIVLTGTGVSTTTAAGNYGLVLGVTQVTVEDSKKVATVLVADISKASGTKTIKVETASSTLTLAEVGSIVNYVPATGDLYTLTAVAADTALPGANVAVGVVNGKVTAVSDSTAAVQLFNATTGYGATFLGATGTDTGIYTVDFDAKTATATTLAASAAHNSDQYNTIVVYSYTHTPTSYTISAVYYVPVRTVAAVNTAKLTAAKTAFDGAAALALANAADATATVKSRMDAAAAAAPGVEFVIAISAITPPTAVAPATQLTAADFAVSLAADGTVTVYRTAIGPAVAVTNLSVTITMKLSGTTATTSTVVWNTIASYTVPERLA